MDKKEKVLKFFENEAAFPLMIDEAAGILGVKKSQMHELEDVIYKLCEEGKLKKVSKKRYAATKKNNKEELLKGSFTANEKGFGFVTPLGGGADLFVSFSQSNGALNGDEVLVKKCAKKEKGEKEEATVIKILSRQTTEFAGIFKEDEKTGSVKPYNKKLPANIIVKNSLGAKDGDRVFAKINAENLKCAECDIIEILGKKGDIGLDVLIVLKNHAIKEEFPKNVLAAAKKQAQRALEKEKKKRISLINETIVTIDGEDAKDLDDAVSIKRLNNGNYELGVHVADVSHYVKQGGVIDEEALKRGTSVYPVDRVVPMLPKELSNGICSLNPKEERLCLSVVMEINAEGVVVNKRIFESVIKTTERMSYTDVTAILNGDKKTREKYKTLVPTFILMKELAQILSKKREKRGAINFNFPEAKVILNEEGHAVDIVKYEKGISNGIIEEFMLVCNETVAEFMFNKKIPFVYRVHEAPDEDKLKSFFTLSQSSGCGVKKNKKVLEPSFFQKILKSSEGKNYEKLTQTAVLRTMMKAKYSPENLGHFGLAAEFYCHFTSPIRRYPDLVIHRIIKAYLHKKKIKKEELLEFVTLAAEKSSMAEQNAEMAEREATALKKAEYMAGKIGESFFGCVSSVTSFGMFVELDNTVEGLVSMTELSDDYYEYDENMLSLTGVRHGRSFKIGDTVKIRVIRANNENGEIDFALADIKSKNKQTKKRKTESKKMHKSQKATINTKRFLKKKSHRGKRKK